MGINQISFHYYQRRKKVQDKTQKGVVADLPINNWMTFKCKIFITVPRLVHDTFYKLIIQGDIYNGQVKMNEKEGIVKFQHENKNIII